MTDEQVLNMPVRRFWGMDSCIDRINAAKDFRSVAVAQGSMTEESGRRLVEKLTLELGETCQIERSAMVAPEPGAKQKMLSLMRK